MAVDELRLVLTVDDVERMAAFFRDALGLRQLATFENLGGKGFLLDAGHATLELFDEAQARAVDDIEVGRRVAGRVRIAFRTDDSEADGQRLEEAGGAIIAGPIETPWHDRNVRLIGPEDIQLTLFTPAAAETSR